MALRAAIFDMGGVFTTSPVTNFAAYETANGIPVRFMSEVIRANLADGAFSRFERGEMTIDEFDEAFAAETRAAGHEVAGRTLVGLLKLEFRPEMIAALDRIIAAGLKTGCITNNITKGVGEEWARTDEDRAQSAAPLAKFDDGTQGAMTGMRKH